MQITHPVTARMIEQRNVLLQKSMRPENLPFNINEEYPIILHSNNVQYSYCTLEKDNVIAHANLWPRKIYSKEYNLRLNIGLIGNVATDPAWRKKGIMAQLLQHLENNSKENGIEALILWSDLEVFYRKLGYTSLNKELHFTFKRDEALKEIIFSKHCYPVYPNELTTSDLEQLLAIRYKTDTTIERTIEEFKLILHTPATHVFISKDQDKKINGFCVIGKGYDMVGVVHEWGGTSPEIVLQILKTATQLFDIDEILILTPTHLDQKWVSYFKNKACSYKEQAMAWVKYLTDNTTHKSVIDKTFIWGLDSI